MDEPRGHYAERNQPGIKRQTSRDLSCRWDLKKPITMQPTEAAKLPAAEECRQEELIKGHEISAREENSVKGSALHLGEHHG